MYFGMGLRFARTGPQRYGGVARLFSRGEQGVWYDPSDLSTLFQDSAGTTPVTASGQPVGLMLDKSKGLVRGPELVVNGRFDNGLTGWTQNTAGYWVTVGSRAYHAPSNVYNELRQTFTGATKAYEVSFSLDVIAGTAQVIHETSPATGLVARTFPVGVHEFKMVVTSGIGFITFSRSPGSTTEFYVDNISVRELPGNHATQPTAASRPIYRRGDSRGVVNLLTWSEDFDNAAWNKSSTTVAANAAASPFGDVTADKITASGASSALIVPFSAVAGQSYTFSVYVKTSSAPATLSIILFNQGYSTNFGATGFTTSGEWRRITVSGTSPTTQTAAFSIGGASTFSTGEELFIWGAQLNTGPTALPYQRNDANLGGVATGASTDLHWLECDGVDDGMVTGNIDFTGTDKVSVFAGVRKLSDAAQAVLFEASTDSFLNSGSFAIFAPVGTGGQHRIRSRGSVVSDATGSANVAPDLAVLTGAMSIGADLLTLRRNGAQIASSSSDQGTGNFGNYPLYLFRRGGTSLPFNGWFYGLAITGRLTTAAETVATERFLAAKSAVVIP